MVDITVTRRVLKKDYFQEYASGAGYAVTGATPNTMPYFHMEKDYLDDLDDSSHEHTITVEFGKAFAAIPIMSKFEVYRYYAVVPGKYRRKDVKYYHAIDWLDGLDGFIIEIEANEDLTGVIIEYIFIEQ